MYQLYIVVSKKNKLKIFTSNEEKK